MKTVFDGNTYRSREVSIEEIDTRDLLSLIRESWCNLLRLQSGHWIVWGCDECSNGGWYLNASGFGGTWDEKNRWLVEVT